jgi:carboxypeptidase C (cathepsin A)
MYSVSLLAFALAGLAYAAPEEDRVLEVPGMAVFDNFGFYSGYLPIPDTGKSLHYLFAESQSNPSTDPLIIWFNGGPGCSSMLGWAQEHGPYVMDSGTDFWRKNDYSWNNEANVIYIESPAGVGYSFCSTLKECSFTDEKSSLDNLTAVLAWFEKFPEFKGHDLYISGESYAGIYVPYLSYQIDLYNTAHAADDTVFKPNLQGFMVGNGVTNWNYDTNNAYVEMAFFHSLYDTTLYQQFKDNNCNFGGAYLSQATPACLTLFSQFQSYTADVNVYDIFGICYGPEPHPQMYNSAPRKSYSSNDYTPWLKNPASNVLPPCTWGSSLYEYLNAAATRDALHIPAELGEWELCTNKIHYKIDSAGSQWIYEALAGKYRMLHYSGDTDGAVPTLGTQNWIASLGWNTTEAWRPYFWNGQVGGYLEAYEGDLTFGTIHGAGHMAPQFKPPQTYHLIFNWLNQTPI